MTFTQPVWLILVIPLAAAMWYWRLPSRLLMVLRALALALVVLAMCDPAVRLPSRAGTVVVVADRSLSMPQGSDAAQAEAIEMIQSKMPTADRLAVVSFGRRAVVELAPQAGRFAGFSAEVDAEGSQLATALAAANSLIPPDAAGRILVLSDGRATGKDPAAEAGRAAARGTPIDYRVLERPATDDLAILSVDAPATVSPQEAFMVTAYVRVPLEQTIRYELTRGGAKVTEGQRTSAAGITRLVFRDRAPKGGTCQYALAIASDSRDGVPENNRARFLVGVRGPKPILCVTRAAASGLARLLAAGGLDVRPASPETCRWDLADLASYGAVVIENTPAGDIGPAGMENLAAWVDQAGAGLMMTGGKDAYGPGGYYRSPLEPVMPVSMELRREHRKLSVAIVVAMDRSGSMAIPVAGGKTKMDLANLAAVEVLELLTNMDEFGCVVIDSSPHIVVPLAQVDDKAGASHRIRRTDSMGGGIFIYVALSTAAKMVAPATAGTKHIILFADAADSEEPGNYKALLEECRKAGITVSVIGLGTPRDQDAELLRDIAKRGGGRIFFTDRATELPRLFAQDTFVVARNTFLDTLTPVRATGGMTVLTDLSLGPLPAVGGYNLCYLRPGANLAAVTTDEYASPLVAAWQAGSGRVLCYTGEADGEFTGPVARWDRAGDFFTSLARWTAGQEQPLPAGMLLRQEIRDGACTVELHLDPEQPALPFTGSPTVTTLRGKPGGRPETRKDEMQWATPDVMAASIPLGGQETALASVEVPGIGRFSLPPACLPYSPEFMPAEPGQGQKVLARLSRMTGGEQRTNLAGIWGEIPSRPRYVNLAPWLAVAAILLLLVEVLERRTGLLSAARLGRFRLRRKDEKAAPAAAPRPKRRKKGEKPAAAQGPSPEPEKPAAESPTGLGDVLDKARRRAKERTDRREM
jgi:uncharacterized membrane protein